MSKPNITQDLLDYIAASPTPFHAVDNAVKLLEKNGFTALSENEQWQCEANAAYYVTRNNSSIIAFRTGDTLENGINMLGAHTDSPCLKIKPNAEYVKHGSIQLGVEVYGGALLNPWFDRDLSIAGRVSGVTKSGTLFSELIDFNAPIAMIPSLAIHLDREANSKKTINAQNHLPLIIAQSDKAIDFKSMLLEKCNKKSKAEKIYDFDLYCYDTQKPSFVGLNQDYIASARLDNLLSSYIGLRTLIDANKNTHKPCLFVSTDHEEIGSESQSGAKGTFLKSSLENLLNSNKTNISLAQIVQKSHLLSCDNAHAQHPNFSDKHDSRHAPIINKGLVIKINANQRYASNSVTSARFQHLCDQNDIPVQLFAVRSDMGCGSTIGPITATELGVPTLDIGAPQWAMHSIRETAGVQDCDYLYRAISVFLNAQ